MSLTVACASRPALPGAQAAPLALTECVDGAAGIEPRIWGQLEVLDQLSDTDYLAVRVHERKHAEQIRRFPNCTAWTQWYRANRARAEAEAFCAGAQAQPELAPAMMRAARWLSGGYPELRLTLGQALILIGGFCL